MSSVYLGKCVSMTEDNYEIRDEALVRHSYDESEGLEKNELVLSREEFLACYNKWVKEQQPAENGDTKIKHEYRKYTIWTVDMLIDRLEEVSDKSKKVFAKNSEATTPCDRVEYVHNHVHIASFHEYPRNKNFSPYAIALSVEQVLQHLYDLHSLGKGNSWVTATGAAITIKEVSEYGYHIVLNAVLD